MWNVDSQCRLLFRYFGHMRVNATTYKTIYFNSAISIWNMATQSIVLVTEFQLRGRWVEVVWPPNCAVSLCDVRVSPVFTLHQFWQLNLTFLTLNRPNCAPPDSLVKGLCLALSPCRQPRTPKTAMTDSAWLERGADLVENGLSEVEECFFHIDVGFGTRLQKWNSVLSSDLTHPHSCICIIISCQSRI